MSYLLAFCLALCWGTAFLATKNIVDVLPPYWCTFFRVLTGLLFFVVLYGLQRKDLRISPKQLWRPWLIGFMLILLPFAALSKTYCIPSYPSAKKDPGKTSLCYVGSPQLSSHPNGCQQRKYI